MKILGLSLAFLIGAASGAVAQDEEKVPFWQKLDAKITGSVGEFRLGDYEGDSAEFDITTEGGKVKIEELNVTAGENRLDLSGELDMPRDLAEFDPKQVDLELSVDARDVKQFIAQQTGRSLTGELSVTGKLVQKDGLISGSLVLAGSEVSYAGLDLAALSGTAEIERSVVHLRGLRVALAQGGQLAAVGTYDLRGAHAYTGELTAGVPQLRVFEPLLRSFGQQAELAGALTLDWKGRGQLSPAEHSGGVVLDVRDGRYQQTTGISAHVAGTYSPEVWSFPDLRLATSAGGLRADLALREKVLQVSDLSLRQNGAVVATGAVRAPLDLAKIQQPAELIPADGEILIDLQSQRLNLAQIPGLEDQKLQGRLSANLHVEGKLDALRGDLKVRAAGLKSAAMGQLAPASAELTVTLGDDRLTAAGTLRQPEIQPLAITGSMPFDVPAVLRERRIDPSLPITASLRLPSSSLDFLRKLSPAIESIRGRAAADVEVRGTIRNPELSGSLTAEIPNLRLDVAAVNEVRDARLALRFRGQTLFVETFTAKIGGGPLNLSGTVQLADLAKPVLDLALRSDAVLLVRNDTIVARADLALSLTGPLASARLAGTVGIVESEFFREVEILPLKLPGRPAPAVAQGAAKPISFTAAPLRDWTFDVAIETRDPFLIVSNLATGSVVGNLRLSGTGLAPTLVGTAEVKDLVASLPFSRLRIVRGFITFTPGGALLNPTLDLRGVSEIRDYRIDIYISGTAQNPETLFVSRPPLPQEEIISLLATGATREELTGNENVLAGRATWLFLQNLYGKIFGGDMGGDDIAFLDRIDVDLGGVDPQTGEQSLVTRFDITKNWRLIGIANVGGGVQGRIKYVMRFR